MKSSSCCQWALLLLPLLAFGMAAPGIAGEPTDQMKQTTDKILSDSDRSDFEGIPESRGEREAHSEDVG